MAVLLWAGYCAFHSYLISIRITDLMTRILKNYFAFYRLFYIVISFVLIVPLINYTAQIESNIIIVYTPPWSVVRLLVTWGSLLIFAWAFFFNYDSLSFFGIRQILSFGKPKKTDRSSEIKRNGLLGIVRHPMYFALILYLWSQTFRVMDVVTNTVLTIYVLIGTKLEEDKLILEFGDTYVKYQREVPMLIPFTKTKTG
ncbi:MAG: hypothetical protein NTV54_13815 [Ignavibacteriales bacterium]|nr:hypothetical protein [Ignavibacteriales bacterium]